MRRVGREDAWRWKGVEPRLGSPRWACGGRWAHGTRRTDDLGKGLEAELLDLVLTHEHECAGAVVEVARVRGGDGAGLVEDGAERRDLGGEDLLVLLVLNDDRVALARVRDRDGRNLLGERAGGPGGRRTAVRLERERVLVLARDRVVLGRLLGAAWEPVSGVRGGHRWERAPVSHRKVVVDVRESVLDDGVLGGHVAERGWYTRVVETAPPSEDQLLRARPSYERRRGRLTARSTCSPCRQRS